jgi:hypothetical protein
MLAAAQSEAFAEVKIPRAAVAALLKSLGVMLDTVLADAHILGAYDTLAAIELANSFEPVSSAAPAIAMLHTWATPQPEPVRLSQQLLLQQAPAESLPGPARQFLLDLLAGLPMLSA